MLAGFSALNEWSDGESDHESSDNGSKSQESVEFRDEDYLTLYNRALASYGQGVFDRAENEFRHLVVSPYFAQCGYKSGLKKRPVTVQLQFNSHKYLGLCLAKREAYKESLDQLEKALDIDRSDPILFFKFAVTAVRAGDLMAARNALEVSFRLTETVPGQEIRHWPSLDLVISVTYKLEDYIACLRYIEWALKLDPNYEKGKRLQNQIYEECPYLHSDPEIQKRPIKPRPIEVNIIPPAPKPETKLVKIKKASILDIVESVVNEYHEGGNGRMKDLLLPCKFEIDNSVDLTEELNDAKVVLDSLLDKVESQEVEEKMSETEQIIRPLLIDEVVNKAVTLGFMRDIILKAADFAVGESFANSMSKKGRSSGPSASFLNEVPLDLIEKRRSARRGQRGCGLDSNSESLMEINEDMTAKALLESLFPPSLQQSSSAHNTPLKKLTRSPAVKKESSSDEVQIAKKEEWLSPQLDEDFAKKCIEDCMTTNSCLNSCLEQLLLKLTDRLADVFCWPRNFDKAFLGLYLCWRPHFVLPHEFGEQEPHEFLHSMVIANEIILRDLTSISIYESESAAEKVELLSEFLWDDLQHLVLNMFRLPRPMAVRILSLHLHYYKFKGKVHAAAGMADKMKPFLDMVKPEDLKTPIIDYEIFRKEMVDAFIENQRNRQLISSVNQLFAQKEYSVVKDVLLANLESNETPALSEARVFHLLMMVESLWHLDDYPSTMAWIEQSLDELMKCKDSEISTPNDKLNLLRTLECCLVMLNGDFSPIEEKSRLANNLLKLILLQIDGDEECGLGEKTVLPWVLLHKLIVFEEKSEKFEDDVPYSVNFLCSAHDYLGPLSLCTVDGGKILTLMVTGVVDTLFKGVANKATNDQMCRNIDQALFCLYAHPSKKSKARHLVDHNINNVAFTWEGCLKPYVYLRPSKLPEYDDLKSASISSETLTFFKRIIALVPDHYRIHKRAKLVKNYLMNNSSKFPTFEDLSESDESESEIAVVTPTTSKKGTPFPPVMVDLFYLMADYYIKNSEFKLAIDFYLIDLSWNPQRLDSWVSLSLSLCNQLESKINEMDNTEISKETIKQILNEARAIRSSFSKCNELAPANTTVRIESGNFGYAMLAFCGRQMNEENVENLSMDLFNSVEELRPIFADFALDNYDKAVQITTQKAKDGTIDDNEHDERWLSYLMTGKIKEKQKKPLMESLELYLKAMENLVSQGATVPKKINFNSPPEWTLELLEVYFRFHASILKLELKSEHFPLDNEKLLLLEEVLQRFETVANKAFDGLNISPGLNSSIGEPAAKVPRNDNDTVAAIIKSETLWASLSGACLKGLELTVQRFPQQFKALHLLAQYYIKSKRHKDLKKARKYLWGCNDNGKSPSLFGERKGNNLFSGIWRMPLNEVDRAGSFSTHMGKCINTLLEFSNLTNDHGILLEVAIQLRKAPNSDQKYLYEKQRKSFGKTAVVYMKKAVKAKVEAAKSKTKEARLSLLLEIHALHLKLRKSLGHAKDDTISALMIELYKSISGAATASFEEVNNFCNKANAAEKKPNLQQGPKPNSEPKPSTSSSKNQDNSQVKAALDYMNAANYYNELMASMMMASAVSNPQAASNAEAINLMNAYAAASYSSLLQSIPNTISVTKTDKNKAASPNKPQASTSGSNSVPKLPPSVTVSKSVKPKLQNKPTTSANVNKAALLAKSGVNVSKVAKSQQQPTASITKMPKPSMNKPKLQPNSLLSKSQQPQNKTASAMAVDKIYKKASSVKAHHKALPGVTVSRVTPEGKVQKPRPPMSNISKAAVASAAELLKRTGNTSLTKIKPMSQNSGGVSKPSSTVVTDDDVICID